MTPPIVPGKNGMSTVLLSHPSGSSADVYLNGAHVTSWIPAGGREVLFMGKTATFAPGDPIRGGIPVVWPQFANIGPLPQHGFARKTEWQLVENADSSDDPSSIKLVLTDDHRTRELWPYHFRTELTVVIDDKSLHVTLDAFNTGDELFSFTTALHTYLAVSDIRETAIRGFTGKWYLDKTQGGNETKDEAKKLVISDETDRVYLKAPKKVEVEDRGNDRRIEIRSAGFKDAVVWNPWAEKVTGFIGLDTEGAWRRRRSDHRWSSSQARRGAALKLWRSCKCPFFARPRSAGSAISARRFSELVRGACARHAKGRCAMSICMGRSSRR